LLWVRLEQIATDYLPKLLSTLNLTAARCYSVPCGSKRVLTACDRQELVTDIGMLAGQGGDARSWLIGLTGPALRAAGHAGRLGASLAGTKVQRAFWLAGGRERCG